MSVRYLSLAVALLLAAPSYSETARSRSGSSRGVHASGGTHHAPPSAGQNHGGSGGPTGAQSRHPRAGTGHGPRGYYNGYYGRPYYPYGAYWGYGGYPYFDFYGSWGYGGYGYYGASYYGGGAYYGGPYYDHSFGSVRVLVDPSDTRVFVDGHYAGMADEFDGLFQRLHASPGRHEIALKLEGYRTHRMRVFVPYDGTLKLHHDMVKGAGEDPVEDLVGERYADEAQAEREEIEERRWRDAGEAAVSRPEPSARRPARGDESSATLRLLVSPPGASIYVDGEFRGTGASLSRLDLTAGSHQIEILHPGLRSFEREVALESGESQDLAVELTR